MSLRLGDALTHIALRYLTSFVGAGRIVQQVPGLETLSYVASSGVAISEPSAILAALSPENLMGVSALEKAEVIECLGVFQPPGNASLLKTLEGRLVSRSYVAGARLTVADALAVFTATPVLETLPALTAFPEIVRWLRQVGAEAPSLYNSECSPKALNLPSAPSLKSILDASSSGAVDQLTQGGGKKEKKEKDTKAPAPAAPPVEERSPLSEIDFGVGQIVEAWPHPESDKLWCEKISFGSGEPVREIASGLRAHFSQDQMTGQRVVVVRNLKSRKLAGFASNGMVLCATGADGSVEFVEPPPGAALGERCSFEGHAGAAAEPNRVDKKKLFEAVAPGLKLVAGVATWDGIPFLTSAGPCKVKSLLEGPVK